MASIKQCDICGEIYEGRKSILFSDIWSSTVSITDYGTYPENESPEYERYELCVICMTRVRNFIHNMNTHIEAEPIEYSSNKPNLVKRLFKKGE